MSPASLRLTIRLALLGIAVQILSIAITIVAFNRANGVIYSPLNHFVSELTSPTLSPWAGVMSVGMAVGSVLCLPSLWALSRTIGSGLARMAFVPAVVSTAAVVALAFTPMENLGPHLLAASVFFWSWLLTVFLFGLAVWWRLSFRAAPLLTIASVLAVLASAAFLTILYASGILGGIKSYHLEPRQILEGLRAAQRPTVWVIAILEWGVVLFVFVWVGAALRFLQNAARSRFSH